MPLLVLTRQQDHVEAINQMLRRAGHAVHCTWIPDANDLGDALIQINPELLVVFADEELLPLEALSELRARTQPPVPLILVRHTVDEPAMAAGLRAGARDVVSLAETERLQLVCTRELRTFRLERALNATLSSAREHQRALRAFMNGSTDAIAHYQEGIIVDANPAWLELYGYTDEDALRGQPAMDCFDVDSHAALKGGLAACLAGSWHDHVLRVTALRADGVAVPLQMRIAEGEFDGEPAVRFIVPAHHQDEAEMQRRLATAVRTDPVTGLLHRRYFAEELAACLAEPVKGGVRYIACVRPDRMAQVLSQIGPLQAEDFMTEFAGVVREHAALGDLAGRFSGSTLMFLVERGTSRDVEAWAEHIVQKVAEHVFRVHSRSLTATVTIGLSAVPPSVADPSGPVSDAVEATRSAADLGGNRFHSLGRIDTDLRAQAHDKAWVRQIKAALMENRFRLVQQPIASLVGEDKGMFDVLVRMLDEQGKEVLPSEFIPAAERNDLMKNIDRWVVGASMSFCAARKPAGIFVRLSKDTVHDKSLPGWLSNQLKANRIKPHRLCFQVPQEVADQYLHEAKALHEHCRQMGFRFAIEHFGAGSADPRQIIAHLKPDFVKIDGALMQGLPSSPNLQEKIKDLVQLAKNVGAMTIAERVEDANTMAVLWQLGIEYIQGYFVHTPEEVVLG